MHTMTRERSMDCEHLEVINRQLQDLSTKLEASNARMTTAILILTDIITDIMPHIVTDEATLGQLKAATQAAKTAALL